MGERRGKEDGNVRDEDGPRTSDGHILAFPNGEGRSETGSVGAGVDVVASHPIHDEEDLKSRSEEVPRRRRKQERTHIPKTSVIPLPIRTLFRLMGDPPALTRALFPS
jgi:hypothetical protein